MSARSICPFGSDPSRLGARLTQVQVMGTISLPCWAEQRVSSTSAGFRWTGLPSAERRLSGARMEEASSWLESAEIPPLKRVAVCRANLCQLARF